jgi:hypothetical protein
MLFPTHSPPSECVLPPHQRPGGGGGGYILANRHAGVEGVGGQYFGRRQADWPLTV